MLYIYIHIYIYIYIYIYIFIYIRHLYVLNRSLCTWITALVTPSESSESV